MRQKNQILQTIPLKTQEVTDIDNYNLHAYLQLYLFLS